MWTTIGPPPSPPSLKTPEVVRSVDIDRLEASATSKLERHHAFLLAAAGNHPGR